MNYEMRIVFVDQYATFYDFTNKERIRIDLSALSADTSEKMAGELFRRIAIDHLKNWKMSTQL